MRIPQTISQSKQKEADFLGRRALPTPSLADAEGKMLGHIRALGISNRGNFCISLTRSP